jgi:hypothetical protein
MDCIPFLRKFWVLEVIMIIKIFILLNHEIQLWFIFVSLVDIFKLKLRSQDGS